MTEVCHDFFVRHLYRQTFGEEKGQKAPIKVEETEEQKAARMKESKKLKVEEEDEEKEGDLKVKQEEGAEPMKKVYIPDEASSSDSVMWIAKSDIFSSLPGNSCPFPGIDIFIRI